MCCKLSFLRHRPLFYYARYHKKNVNAVSVDDYSLVTLYLRLNTPKKESLIKISTTNDV